VSTKALSAEFPPPPAVGAAALIRPWPCAWKFSTSDPAKPALLNHVPSVSQLRIRALPQRNPRRPSSW